MSKTDKLMAKLKRGKIDARELRALLKVKGFQKERQRGSHEVWERGSETFLLATHSAELKPYQIKQAQERLLEEESNEKGGT